MKRLLSLICIGLALLLGPAPAFAGYAPVAIPATANPTSVLTRPANTTAYTALDLIASSTTAGSVVAPTITVAATAACSSDIALLKLTSNHTTGLAGVSVSVRLWTTAPTYTNGDNGGYAVATGAAGYVGKWSGVFEQDADGARATLTPEGGFPVSLKLASGTTAAWDLQTNADFTPQSGKTFTLTAYAKQDVC